MLFDRGEKFADYRAIESLRHFVRVTVGRLVVDDVYEGDSLDA